MIDRLGSSGGPPPAHVEKPRQSGRGFADWLEREQRPTTVGGEGAQPDAFAASGMTGQIAEQGASFPDVQVQLRRATGELETISLPWKLAANGSLSQRLLEQAGVGLNVGLGGLDAVAGAANATTQGSVFLSNNTWLAQPKQDGRQMSASGALLPQHVLAAGDIESGDASSPAAMHTQAAMPWLLRLCRWLEQKGHDPSVWLRDYRLDRADAHQLAEALRMHASEQGIRLERIVVNGRELWRAPDAFAKENPDAR